MTKGFKFKGNYSQRRPPRFDQYPLHFLDDGSYEILSLVAIWTDFQLEGQSFQHITARQRFQFLANPSKRDRIPNIMSNQGLLKCVHGGKEHHEGPLMSDHNQLINGVFQRPQSTWHSAIHIELSNGSGAKGIESKIHEVESRSSILPFSKSQLLRHETGV